MYHQEILDGSAALALIERDRERAGTHAREHAHIARIARG
jgi:hypothetical protein